MFLNISSYFYMKTCHLWKWSFFNTFHITDKDFLTTNIQSELHYHCLDRATQEQIKRDLSCKGSVMQIKGGPEKHAQNSSLWVTLEQLWNQLETFCWL